MITKDVKYKKTIGVIEKKYMKQMKIFLRCNRTVKNYLKIE